MAILKHKPKYWEFELVVQDENKEKEITMVLKHLNSAIELFNIKLLPSFRPVLQSERLETTEKMKDNILGDELFKVKEEWQGKFTKGDYYQQTFKKIDKEGNEKTDEVREQYKDVSLGKICHELILENKDKLSYIRNIYSTTLKEEIEKIEGLITYEAIHFWILQLLNDEKNLYIYDKKLRKFKFTVNK